MNKQNNKSSHIYLVIFIIIAIVLLLFIFRDKLFQKSPDDTNNNINNDVARLAQESNVLGNNERLNEVNNKIENVLESSSFNELKEEELSSFSTKLSGSTENRLTNIRITCGKLNETVVNSGDTFSFCNSTGPSTAEEGYKDATVFLDGKEVQALGGGNCQVSSTLYNAVLKVPDFEVLERHEHGKDVSYVPDGKDAAVAYGSIDFKFKNNMNNKIKLYFSTDDVSVAVRIVKLV